MRRSLPWLVLFVLCSCEPERTTAPWESREDGLTAVTGFGSNPGALSLFIHQPTGLGNGVPLVVALHGCGQTANAYSAVGWDALADQDRFLVAYPETSGNGGCFDWFSANQQVRTGPQVTSILQMVQHLVATRGVDPTRVYVTGLSAGGAMANVLLAVAPDVFSRGGVLAGIPFACATTASEAFGCLSAPPSRAWGNLVRAVNGGGPAPRVSLWHGANDTTVSPANLAEEVLQWTDVNGLGSVPTTTGTVGAATRREYKDSQGVVRVETWSIGGMNHGTPIDAASGCGTSGPFVLDVGICSSRYLADFFGLGLAVDAGGGTGGGAGGGVAATGGGSATGGGGGIATGGGAGGGTPTGGGFSISGGGGGGGEGSGCGCSSAEGFFAFGALVFGLRRRFSLQGRGT